ncbi:hypothetical protein C621_0217910 [Bacillus thuringiensis serovar aizawai str. Leapi01]|nr:hypothetical protein C621_0217910 [Bacillus thuringiensis serovar aizawai str. Leapi01]ETE97815.1 hypothetical protein C623_0212460 [Bacillus thuringiensis serovar aizawai str. Hu4-2]
MLLKYVMFYQNKKAPSPAEGASCGDSLDV